MGCVSGRPSQEDLGRGLERRPGGNIGAIDAAPKLPPRALIGSYANDYKVERTLRKGLCTALHKATNVTRLLKELKKPFIYPEDDRAQYLQKMDNLLPLDHPHILKLPGLYEDSHCFYIVSDLPHNDLLSFLVAQSSLTERVLALLMMQVLGGLQFLHKKSVLHHDLRIGKVVLKSEAGSWDRVRLALADFGASSSLTEIPGPGYLPFAPPESFFMDYTEKSDLWSAGCILYILVNGSLPFHGKDDFETRLQIETLEPTYSSGNWTVVSKELKAFVQRLLAKDSAKRPTVTEALIDPWLMTYARQTADGPALDLRDHMIFSRETRLCDAVGNFTAVQELSLQELEKLASGYAALDIDKDGAIGRGDLVSGLLELVSKEEATAWINAILAKGEISQVGAIQYEPVVDSCATIGKELAAKELKIAIKGIYVPQGGRVETKELKRVLGRGVVGNEGVWGKLMLHLDRSHEADLDAGDFSDRVFQAYS